jgi:hypothetical protein
MRRSPPAWPAFLLVASLALAAEAVTFPISVSANKRYLQDATGTPFPILGRASWFVISLGVTDYKAYIDDTVAKGYTAIEFIAITHDPRANNPPHDGNGDLPFLKTLGGGTWSGSLNYANPATDAPDLTTPNETYWLYVDAFLDYCQSKGIVVFMFPAYVGYTGTPQGWMVEVNANGPTKMNAYGAFIANRFKNRGNIVWMMGGDKGGFSATEASAEQGLITGLKSAAGQQSTNFSAEWDSESICTDQTSFGSNCTLNGAYSFNGNVNTHGRNGYGRTPVMPAFLLEEPYDQEGPDGNGVNPQATQPVRRLQWWGWLSSIGGYISGNGYVWPFNPGVWNQHLSTQGGVDMSRLNTFVTGIKWWTLVPSGLGGMKNLISAGGSTPSAADYVAAAAASDGTLLVAYVPPAHNGPISVDMTAMSSPARARWFNPTTAEVTLISSSIANTGTQAFTTPGNNGTGFNDWVLVLDPATASGTDGGTSVPLGGSSGCSACGHSSTSASWLFFLPALLRRRARRS